MKRKYIAGSLMLALLSFTACVDVNDDFDLADDPITNVAKIETTYSDKVFPSTDVAKDAIIPWLKSTYYTCDEGSTAAVSYQVENTTVSHPERMMVDFDYNMVDNADTQVSGWLNYTTTGDIAWQDKTYSGNGYTNISAQKAEDGLVAWFISPKMRIEKEDMLSFEVCVGYYNADCLSVLISTDFAGNSGSIANEKYTHWTDVTANFVIPKEPEKGYGTLASAGSMDLSEYAGSDVYIAFRYTGNSGKVDPDKKATTTVQLDNIVVTGKTVTKENSTEQDEYLYTNGAWTFVRTVPSGLLFKTVEMTADDFQLIVDYVTATYDAGYLDTQKVGQGEYYYGASSAYSNWNAKGYTRKKYYDPEGLLADMDTDAETNAFAMERVKEGIVKFVELKYPGPVMESGNVMNYIVKSKVYQATTDNYIAKVLWDETAQAYKLESFEKE